MDTIHSPTRHVDKFENLALKVVRTFIFSKSQMSPYDVINMSALESLSFLWWEWKRLEDHFSRNPFMKFSYDLHQPANYMQVNDVIRYVGNCEHEWELFF